MTGQAQVAGEQTRDALEGLADNLGNLEFDLTFSVEFPLMRIETFHTARYEAMDLSGQARALSQMFGQLGGSVRSEITAIDVRDRQRDEERQKWNAFAAGVLSLLGVSVGVVIAFLGVNAKEVPSALAVSMWSPRFTPLYLVWRCWSTDAAATRWCSTPYSRPSACSGCSSGRTWSGCGSGTRHPSEPSRRAAA
jgi:hypothetical protein